MSDLLTESSWRTLWEASRTLHSLLSLDDLLPSVNRLVCDLLECECVSLLIVDPETDSLRPFLAVGQRSERVRNMLWQPGRGVAGRVLSRNEPERINDPATDPDGDFSVEASLGVTVRNLLAAPLERAGNPVGIVEAVNKKDGAFTDVDFELFRLLASDIASAVDNARTYERELRQRTESEILQRVAERLARSLELKDVLEGVFDALAELVRYDAAAIYIMDRGGRGTLAQIAMRGYDAGQRKTLELKCGTGVVGTVCDSGRGLIVPDVAREPRYVNAREATRSEVTAPMISGTQVIGAFNLESDRLHAFDEHDLQLLEAFASNAAIAVERAQLYEAVESKQRIERELSLARTIQRSFQPRGNPSIPGIDLAGFNLPSEAVGGDYYDFIHITEGHYGIALADVSGKGIPAALIMSGFRASLIAEIRNNYAIRTVLAKVNRLLVESIETGRFVTGFYGVLDVERRRLTYANAGHNPPLLLRAGGKAEELRSTGPLLGTYADSTFKERTLDLHAGDLLLLYTDGLTEAQSPENEEFGLSRVEGLMRTMGGRSSEQVCAAMLAAVREFSGSRRLEDDITLVALRATESTL